MAFVDYCIFVFYFLMVLAVGIYFYFKNSNREDYFVGGRNMSPVHIGISIVATDVGGGFSIGLGGLGYLMGIAGSWLLFSGLIGAWMAAVLIIPRLKSMDKKYGMLTYPDFLRKIYGPGVALVAAIISGLGYLGFAGGQILAGAKLAAGTVFSNLTVMEPLTFSLFIMASVVIAYTVLGGLKAVVYTDTIQWVVLLFGLAIFGVPFAIQKVGGLAQLRASLPAEFFSLGNISPARFINWFFTIVPIWFIAMTLYQRIYATKNVRDARISFYIAGLLEYPVMAFLGVVLGMVARVFFPNVEAEMGLPMLLKDVLPIGITGIIISAYFSAIMSTADSCLIASSGNFVNDIIARYFLKKPTDAKLVKISQIVTLIIGLLTLVIASRFTTVLEIILHTYSFMVGGLLVPTLFAFFGKNHHPTAALLSMLTGGILTLVLIFTQHTFIEGIDESIFGIMASFVTFILSLFVLKKLERK
ncbi:MAG: sodium:solute symporter family protein [Candidatus Marinimicrobia bacterium]|nr:sodium:solute symporter family protein [Candidatus Neomarinimicrobiota bacterium]